MTRREISDRIIATAEPLYGHQEAVSIAAMIMEKLYGVSRLSTILEPDVAVECAGNLEGVLADIASARPVQYILGECEFCGMRFELRPGVLVPRPETEELVEWIISETPQGASILDIGTGSGAIAVVLAKRIEGARLRGIDISPQALSVATKNATLNSADVEFMCVDALLPVGEWQGEWRCGEWDVVVSNPPYIPRSELTKMHPNVIKYEPHEALFVDDNDPLIFYKSIARHSLSLLRVGGALYFEIYELAGAAIVDMLGMMGYVEVELRADINGKERMIRCRKK